MAAASPCLEEEAELSMYPAASRATWCSTHRARGVATAESQAAAVARSLKQALDVLTLRGL